jgi:hypothetical protein
VYSNKPEELNTREKVPNYQSGKKFTVLSNSKKISEIERDFLDEIYKTIGSSPDSIIFNTEKWQEFSSSTKFKNNKNCRYIATQWTFQDKEYARISFIDFTQSGDYITLESWGNSSFTGWTEADRAEFKRQNEQVKEELEVKQKEHELERIETANKVYESGKEIQEIPIYLKKKCFSIEDISSIAKHLRQHEDFISYPLYHHETKEFIGIQRICENNSKFILGKTGFFNIGFPEAIPIEEPKEETEEEKLDKKFKESQFLTLNEDLKALRENEKSKLKSIVETLKPILELITVKEDEIQKLRNELTPVKRISRVKNDHLDIIYIVEGLATGLSVYLAVNKPVIVANQANLLSKAVKMARLDYPDSLIVVATDKDYKSGAGENSAIKACEGVVGAVFKLPYLKNKSQERELREEGKGLDFDDLRRLEGIERVREILEDEKGYIYYQSDGKLREIIQSNNEWAVEAEKAQNVKGKENHYCHLEVTELLNRVIAFTQIGGKSAFVNRKNLENQEGLEVWLKDHLQDKFANEKAFIGFNQKGKAKFSSYFNIWLESSSRKDYKGVVFLPMKEGKGYLNLFQGFKYKTRKTIDTDFFWTHLFEILCSGDNESYIYVKKWLSHIFQKPYELSRTAIVIPNSGQGTGKGFFLSQIGKLLGNYYTELTDIERLGARFNSHIAGKLFINANEATWGGNKSKEGALKALITDPTHLMELKHKEAVLINNYARLFVTSNEDWAVPVGMDDRRFIFIEASDRMKDNTSYFDPMIEKVNKEGFSESLMFDLVNEDIEGWNPRNRPKKSFELAKGHKLSSMPLVLSWWNDYVNGCEDWKETITREELRLDFENWCTRNKRNHIPPSEKFWPELKEYFPKEVNSGSSNRKYMNGSQQRIISNLNQDSCLRNINKLFQLEENTSIESDIPF